MAKKTKGPKLTAKNRCVICRLDFRYNAELCEECDTSYEAWLTENKGSSLRWAAARVRGVVLSQMAEKIGEIP